MEVDDQKIAVSLHERLVAHISDNMAIAQGRAVNVQSTSNPNGFILTNCANIQGTIPHRPLGPLVPASATPGWKRQPR